jgi:hypothetical protein
MDAGLNNDRGLEQRTASLEVLARMSLEALLYYVLAGRSACSARDDHGALVRDS